MQPPPSVASRLDPPQLVAVVDSDARLLALRGESSEDVAGQAFVALLRPMSRSTARRAVRTALATGQPVRCRVELHSGDELRCEFAPLPEVEGRRLVAVTGRRTTGRLVTIDAKYVAVDVVGFTCGRVIEAQADVVTALGETVRAAVRRCELPDEATLYLPTGDGIIVALLDVHRPRDVHIRLAIGILEYLDRYNRTQLDPTRRFDLRVAVNENIDAVVTDVNGHRNVAGDGVNTVSRILDLAEGGNILVGERVHERLRCHEDYSERFRTYVHTVKHDVDLSVSQLVRSGNPVVNERVPRVLERSGIRGREHPSIGTVPEPC